jgi:DNA-binding MarR family transcriptional regulator
MGRLRTGSPRTKPREAPARPRRRSLSLQSFLPYRLNILAQAVSGGFSAAYSQTFGISAPEWRVLATVGEFKQITAKDIASHSGMHKTMVSRAVLALDKRQLSAAGRQIYQTVAPMALRYEQRLLDGLSSSDLANLDRLIRHLINRAQQPWLPAAASPAPNAPSKPSKNSTRVAEGHDVS